MRLVFLGPPGAGKGTQAATLALRQGIPHIATGDILRQAIQRGTNTGRAAKVYMDRGDLVPDEVVIQIVRERLMEEDCRQGFILDGFPRTRAQAEALDHALSGLGWALDKVIYFDVPEEEVVRRNTRRLVCRQCDAVYNLDAKGPRVSGRCDVDGGELYQRPDDQEATVLDRLRVFLAKTDPLKAHYAARGILVQVDAVGAMDEVAARVEAILP